MEKVILSPEVKQYLRNLVGILYEKEYFGFKITAKAYVDRIIDETGKYIGIKQHHLTPPRLKKHGRYYASFPVNKRTTWYVFFDKKGDRYYIEYITNNHVSKASALKRLK